MARPDIRRIDPRCHLCSISQHTMIERVKARRATRRVPAGDVRGKYPAQGNAVDVEAGKSMG